MNAPALAALAAQLAALVDEVADVELAVDALVAAAVRELIVSVADLQTFRC